MKTRDEKKKLKKVFRFFNKRIASFIFHFQNSKRTGFITDIHNTRVELKKLVALFELLRCQHQGKAFLSKEGKSLERLFRKMGKLREVQVNLRILSQNPCNDFSILDFKDYLRHHEKRCLRNFILAADSFDLEICSDIQTEMKRVLYRTDPDQFTIFLKKYIRKKLGKIRELQPGIQNIDNAHLIRKHMKSIAVVHTLIYLLKPDEGVLQNIAELNHNEKIIGSWHDKVVFLESLEKYIEESGFPPDQMLNPVHQLKSKISAECEEMFRQFAGSWSI